MKLLEKMFLREKMKNANRVHKKSFKNSAKDTMTHFNITVTVKCCRDK